MLAETLLRLERGQKVRPFEGKTGFLPADLVGLLDVSRLPIFPYEEPVLTTDVEFEGVKGQVAVTASSRIGTDKARTPLGIVKTEIDFTDEVAIVREIPLHLRLAFELHSMQDWQKLLCNRAVFQLGSERFRVRYHLETLDMTVERFEEGFRDFKILPAFGSTLLIPATYSPARVLLPYDVGRLSQGVNLTMGEEG